MSKLFSRWFGSSDKSNPMVRANGPFICNWKNWKIGMSRRFCTLHRWQMSPAAQVNFAPSARWAASGDTVRFIGSLSGGTVQLTGGEIDLNASITIESTPGAGLVTIDAQKNSRVFSITQPNTTCYFTALDIENGKVTGNGAGINTTSNSDNVFVTNSLITGCNATGNGGGIYAQNSLTMVSSSVTNNYAAGHGGGIAMDGAGTIATSTISGNNSGTTNGGGIWCSNYLGITQSTIAYNTAAGAGGGIRCAGAAASLTIVNCTFYKNTATGNGGAISIDGYGTDS